MHSRANNHQGPGKISVKNSSNPETWSSDEEIECEQMKYIHLMQLHFMHILIDDFFKVSMRFMFEEIYNQR